MKNILKVTGLSCLILAVGFYLYTSYLVHQHRQLVASGMKDPDSVKFRNEKLTGGWTLATSKLCGEVNSKNSYGAYSGFVMFASDSGGRPYLATEPGPDAFIEGYCE
nr:hypothetical protein [Comamonas thiooxydans]